MTPTGWPTDTPTHLAERIHCLGERSPQDGSYVLYWMRTAVRAHDNPALDAALVLAQSRHVPVFVYHGLSEGYPHASDRHHRFILEGARDVARELRELGIGYAFHLERPGQRGPWLKTLSTDACAVVTEDFPVAPLTRWTQRLHDAIEAPVYTVDTACVVPMRLFARGYSRAFRFRDAHQELMGTRLERRWAPIAVKHPRFVPDLPFDPIDLDHDNFADLIRQCDIDHTVGPVPNTVGGTSAGYARWHAFQRTGLNRYARDRNDPLRDGCSRMSAYLHYGHVSPFRLARDCNKAAHAGAKKYLEELLIWREVAFNFCIHHESHDSLDALPAWARETLLEHASDPREGWRSRESLARAQMGLPLWDAAQQSLLVHGELHNNVRMTWGKEVLRWSQTPQQALAHLLYLNNRYALDGRDPASYTGILWCFGLLDRPHDPPEPILGRVRRRPIDVHAERLDVKRYTEWSRRPIYTPQPRIGVIGAGIAGAVCARTLSDHGYSVQAFDKGRYPGGRMSSRQRENERFDHGAPYFEVSDRRFQQAVEEWMEVGHIAPWRGHFKRHHQGDWLPAPSDAKKFVGVPSMNQVVAHLLRDVDTRFSTRVGALRRSGNAWLVQDDTGADLGTFDIVVLAMPIPQTQTLLEREHLFQPQLREVQYESVWASMMVFEGPLDAPFDVAYGDEDLALAIRESRKPQRDPNERWVLHASSEWTARHLDDDPDSITRDLLQKLEALLAQKLPAVKVAKAHRWRYARVRKALENESLWDPKSQVGVCGDGCRGDKVEDAYLSGASLAGQILNELAERGREPVFEALESQENALNEADMNSQPVRGAH